MQGDQAGIFTEASQYHRYYEWVFPVLEELSGNETSSELDPIRKLLAKVVELQATTKVAIVVAFSQCCWQHLDTATATSALTLVASKAQMAC